MLIKTKALVLTAESKPYEFGGNEGVSHKIRLNVEGEIYVCKSNAEQVAEVAKLQGKTVNVEIKVNSRKENMSLELLSVA